MLNVEVKVGELEFRLLKFHVPDNFHVPAGSFCTLVIVPVLSDDDVAVVALVLFAVVCARAILTDAGRDNMLIAISDAIETASSNV
jgi:hypothetical protein